ncbi:MAG: UPF0182 family protein [Cyanophyceae cyanobacterium]
MPKRFWDRLLQVLIVLFAIGLVLSLLAYLAAELFWFQEVNYLLTFIRRLQTQLGLWAIASGVSLAFLWGNLSFAQRWQWPVNQRTPQAPSPGVLSADSAQEEPVRSVTPQSRFLGLPSLLTITLGFSLLIALMLVYYTEVAISVWRPDYSLTNVTPPLPSRFDVSLSPRFLREVVERLWRIGAVVGVAVVLLLNQRFWLRAIAVGFSFVFGLVMAGNWARGLQYFSPTPFEQSDPVFGNNISFYLFRFPLWQLLDFWLGGLFLYALVAVTLAYLLSGDSLSQGKFPGFSRLQLRHLYALGGAVMLTLGLHHWLERYQLLYSERGVTYGMSYTDAKVQLPIETVLSVAAIAIAVWLLLKAITGSGKGQMTSYSRRRRQIPFSPWPFLIYLVLLISGAIGSETVQRLVVQPNELDLERPYIERSIALTRSAFDLDDIEVQTFDPQGQLTAEDIAENDLTIDNIRLWDTRPILQTNRQLQQIRLYYRFPDADIDRYTLLTENVADTAGTPLPEAQTDSDFVPVPTPQPPTPATERQQVIIAARELDYSEVPQQAKTWVNRHLVYTHGYGFTLSPVNLVAEGGLPFYYVRNIGTGDDEGALQTSSELIRDSIPIGKPRIYYGEMTDNYIMTDTEALEFDFPSGDENVYFTYDGAGGINIGAAWRRLLFASYLKDWQMLFTDNFTPQTKLLFRRNINRRVRAIAPFLRYDRDPYLVVADGDESQPAHYLYWIIDAYTASDRYPYSDPGENNFNYLRNSVKVVVDAYNGDVAFYIANPSDPIIQTWDKIFPELFQPLAAMPATLRSHIRYPQDLFSTQSERLLTYHMTDPQVFYNREDQWQIPQEIYGTEAQPIEPYYLIIKLPTATSEEFILIHPYTPISRPNLNAWLAGRSDGEEYGNLLLYQFPKQELVYGPNQIEALINQDPIISQQISLWNREGSRVIQGNLLVIPIEQSLLYVEPLYLEAEQNSLPTLARVIVVYESNIVMAETLEAALEAIFTPESEAPAIVRPVEELAPALEGPVPEN